MVATSLFGVVVRNAYVSMSTLGPSFFTRPLYCRQIPGNANNGRSPSPRIANQCHVAVAVRFAERARRHEAAPLLERVTPERVRLNLIVAHIGHGLRCPSLLKPEEAPVHQNDLALAVGCAAHHGRHVPRKYARGRLERDDTIVRDPEEPPYRVTVLVQRVEIAHVNPFAPSC